MNNDKKYDIGTPAGEEWVEGIGYIDTFTSPFSPSYSGGSTGNMSAWDQYIYNSTHNNKKKVQIVQGDEGIGFYGEANMNFYARTKDGKLISIPNQNPAAATYTGTKDNVIIDVDENGNYINWLDDGQNLTNDIPEGTFTKVDLSGGKAISEAEANSIIQNEKSGYGKWKTGGMNTYYDSTSINGKKVGMLQGNNGTTFYGEPNMNFFVRKNGKLIKVPNQNPEAATYTGTKDNVIIDVDDNDNYINWLDNGSHLKNDHQKGTFAYRKVDLSQGQEIGDSLADKIVEGEEYDIGNYQFTNNEVPGGSNVGNDAGNNGTGSEFVPNAWDRYVASNGNSKSTWKTGGMSTYYDSTSINDKKIGMLQGNNGTTFYADANINFFVRKNGKLINVPNQNPEAATYTGTKDNVIIDVDDNDNYINWLDNGSHLKNDHQKGTFAYRKVDLSQGQEISSSQAESIISGEKRTKTEEQISVSYGSSKNDKYAEASEIRASSLVAATELDKLSEGFTTLTSKLTTAIEKNIKNSPTRSTGAR